jgi:membrane protease YdiL (CAAX protease family)
MSQEISSTKQVNWKQVGLFVGLTIALSWLLDLVLWGKFGYSEYAQIFFQLQMLIPALVAIVLQRYAFKESPIYFRTYQEMPRWFFSAYILFTLFFTGLVVATTLKPNLYPVPIASLVMVALVISLLVLVVMRVASGKGSFGQAGISGSKWTSWLLVWLVVMGYHGIQILLNMAFDLGFTPDILPLAEAAGMDPQTFLIAGFINTVVVGPLLGLWIAFGEEYGWRGYLQGELVKLGRVKGVLLVGVVWGVWHAPAVMMGHNYPGHPVLGPIAFLVFNLFLAIFLGYVMLKTGSVWLAAFMHALINQGYQWLTAMVYTPNDPLFSFGAGFYGIAFAFLVSLVVLRDRVWRQN